MAITEEMRTQINELYVGLIGRAPDSQGLNFWATSLDNKIEGGKASDVAIREVAQAMFDADASRDFYPDGLSNEEIVSEFYLNVLGRQGDEDGIAFWTNKLDSGRETGEVLVSMIDAVNGFSGTDQAALNSQTLFSNKVAVSEFYAENISEDGTPDDEDVAAAKALLDEVTTSTDTSTPAATEQFVDDTINAGETFSLTVNPDGTSSDPVEANTFEAPRVFDPAGDDQTNSLQDDDFLKGVGDNPTLNFTYVTDIDAGGNNQIVTPTMENINTINTAFSTPLRSVLDLQDTTGVDELNLTRVNVSGNNAAVVNMQSVPSEMSISNSAAGANGVELSFLESAISGDSDSTILTLDNVLITGAGGQVPVAAGVGPQINQNGLVIEENAGAGATANIDQGIETINLETTGNSSAVSQMTAEDLETLNISGDQSLTLGSFTNVTSAGQREAQLANAGMNNVAGSLTTVNASVSTAGLTIHLGNEVTATQEGTSGVPVDFDFTGTSGDDAVFLTAGIDSADTFAGGEGSDTLQVANNFNNANAEATGFQNLDILNQQNAGTIAVNATQIPDLEDIAIRNEGNTGVAPPTSTASSLTVNLDDVSVEVAEEGIELRHGTTGNSGLAQLTVNLDLDDASGSSDTAVFEIVDADNSNPRFNAQLNVDGEDAAGNEDAGAVENFTIDDNDTEDNTFQLVNVGEHSGTIKLTGGDQGGFLNLDATGNAYGVATNGLNGNATQRIPAGNRDDSFVSDVYGDTQYELSTNNPGANIGYVYNDIATGAAERITASTLDAGDYSGDVIARFGEGNQSITTGSGDDTVIFDVIDPTASTRGTAGLNSGDTVSMGDGVDTMVIDGDNGGSDIELGQSEFSGVSGVDAMRFGNAGGGDYRATLTNNFVNQASGGSLSVINSDGDLSTNVNSDLTLDLRQLDATTNVNFYGSNGGGATNPNGTASEVNTIQVDDVTAISDNTLNGGDQNTTFSYTATAIEQVLGGAPGSLNQNDADTAWEFLDGQFTRVQAAAAASNLTAGQFGTINARITDLNNDVLQISDQADVTVDDLSNVSNLNTVEFDVNQATEQTLNISLDDATVDRMVDASHSASNTQSETLLLNARDNLNPSVTTANTNNVTSVANLDVDADGLTQQSNLSVLGGRGDNNITTGGGNDTVTLLGNFNEGDYGPTTVNGASLNNLDSNLDKDAATTPFVQAQGTIDLGGATSGDTLETYGKINLTSAVLTDIENFVFNSNVRIEASQLADALSAGGVTFTNTGNHTLEIVDNTGSTGTLDFSEITLEGTGTLTIDNKDSTATSGSVATPDGGSVGVSGNQSPTVTSASFSVAEGAANGDAVDTVTTANDQDGSISSYAIISANDVDGDGDAAFSIDSSGAITVNDADELADTGVTNEYSLDIQVADDDAATDSATFTVDVTGGGGGTGGGNGDEVEPGSEETIPVAGGDALTGDDTVAETFEVPTTDALNAEIAGFDPEADLVDFGDQVVAGDVSIDPAGGFGNGEFILTTANDAGDGFVEITLTGLTQSEEINVFSDVSAILA